MFGAVCRQVDLEDCRHYADYYDVDGSISGKKPSNWWGQAKRRASRPENLHISGDMGQTVDESLQGESVLRTIIKYSIIFCIDQKQLFA